MFLGVMFLAQDLSFLLGYAVVWFLNPVWSWTPWGSSEPGAEGAPQMAELQRGFISSTGLVPLLGLSGLFGEKHLSF